MPAPNAEQVERARELIRLIATDVHGERGPCRAEDCETCRRNVEFLLADEAERATTRERERCAAVAKRRGEVCRKNAAKAHEEGSDAWESIQDYGASTADDIESVIRAGDAG